MSDDLVTRLRELNTGMWATQPLELCKEAANEIERLRAESPAWLNEIERLGKAIQIMGERWTLCEQCQEINRKGY